jgi:copper chaperone CopZ
VRTCWQIRAGYPDGPTGGQNPGPAGRANQAVSATGASGEKNGRADGWRTQCADCPVYASDSSCWEQRNGCPTCCAPVHITCDFCILYIEHRREIASLTRNGRAEAHTKIEGGAPAMEKLQLSIPSMWADHHVLNVRDVLVHLDGVGSVYASSAWKQALVVFDPAKTNSAALELALAQAGYPVEDGQIPVMTAPGEHMRDPKWELLGARVTRTNRADVEMSGEFRRY